MSMFGCRPSAQERSKEMRNAFVTTGGKKTWDRDDMPSAASAISPTAAAEARTAANTERMAHRFMENLSGWAITKATIFT